MMQDQATQQKLTPNEVIIKLAHYASENKLANLFQIAEGYADSLSKNGETYHRLKRILKNRPVEMMRLDDLKNDIKNLLIINPVEEENIYLPEYLKKIIDTLLLEWKYEDSFIYHNLPTTKKILLHGPTGNGKTTIARHIARLTELPFVEIKTEAVVDSHLGKSGANVYAILNSIQTRCVLFWDEVDGVGAKRGNDLRNSAGYEMDRVTNTLLVNLDRLKDKVIFIGATNRFDILDSAFVRRFDQVIEIPEPTQEQKLQYLNSLLNYYKLPRTFEQRGEHVSFAEIKTYLLKQARQYVLEQILQKEKPSLHYETSP